MKTQISRDSHQPNKRYSGVYQQQGRMLTDADWNELVEVIKAQLKEALTDIIGSGAPQSKQLSIGNDKSIVPGDLYVDGIRAEMKGTQPIAVTAQTDLPLSGSFSLNDCFIYADVWERPVTCLEDKNLRDVALHGADTCTRTQTMLQVKWCPTGNGPLESIPNIGNASLTLKFRESSGSQDPCDPCAESIEVEAGDVGNYLFRLEVHDVTGDPADPTGITLKWSDENGAEQYEAKVSDDMPPGFIAGDTESSKYVYEFFNEQSEKHLGIHKATEYEPVRGEISETYEIPAGKTHVRRWDGYCTLSKNEDGWDLTKGLDKGQVFTKVLPPTKLYGDVSINADLEMQLHALILTLTLTGSEFVAGDYWLVPVRSAEHDPGDFPVENAFPQGIHHHYLRLADVDADDIVTCYRHDADRRKYNFPPLTDLQAEDVGYSKVCSLGLFDGNQHNVKEALDRLCDLDAMHIAFTPGCKAKDELYHTKKAEPPVATVEAALNKLCDIAAKHIGFELKCKAGKGELFDVEVLGQNPTVQDAFDRLCTIAAQHIAYKTDCESGLFDSTHDTVEKALNQLCKIKAQHVDFEPKEGSDCDLLKDTSVKTVQDALDVLCNNLGGKACRKTVGPGGDYETLEEAITELAGTKSRVICLCLLPGSQDFPSNSLLTTPSLSGKPLSLKDHHLCIVGCGPVNEVVLPRDPFIFRDLASLHLSGFALDGTRADPDTATLEISGCKEVVLESLYHGGVTNERALLEVGGAQRIRIDGNLYEAFREEGLEQLQGVLEFLEITIEDQTTLRYRYAFLQELTQNARILASTLSGNVDKFNELSEKYGNLTWLNFNYLQQIFMAESPPDQMVVENTLSLMRDWAARGCALAVMDAEASTTVSNNDIKGFVSLYGRPQQETLTPEEWSDFAKYAEKIVFDTSPAGFDCCNNRITRFVRSQPIYEQIKNIGTSMTIGKIFRSGHFTDNVVHSFLNDFTFGHLSLTSTSFETLSSDITATALAETAVFVGNRGIKKDETTYQLRNLTHQCTECANLNLNFDQPCSVEGGALSNLPEMIASDPDLHIEPEMSYYEIIETPLTGLTIKTITP